MEAVSMEYHLYMFWKPLWARLGLVKRGANKGLLNFFYFLADGDRTKNSISCTTRCKPCLQQNGALAGMCMERTLMWWVHLRWAPIVCMDAHHQRKAHWDLIKSEKTIWLLEWLCCSNKEIILPAWALHRLIFELDKICNGAVYIDAQHLNSLLLCFSKGVANYKPVIHSTIYIPEVPWLLSIPECPWNWRPEIWTFVGSILSVARAIRATIIVGAMPWFKIY